VVFVEFIRIEMLAVRGGDHRATHEVLNVSGGAWAWALTDRRRRKAGRGVFAVDSGDTPSQGSELFLDILHSPFLCLI